MGFSSVNRIMIHFQSHFHIQVYFPAALLIYRCLFHHKGKSWNFLRTAHSLGKTKQPEIYCDVFGGGVTTDTAAGKFRRKELHDLNQGQDSSKIKERSEKNGSKWVTWEMIKKRISHQAWTTCVRMSRHAHNNLLSKRIYASFTVYILYI